VTRLALFGSVVRDAAHADSDVDILVSFDGPATSSRYFGVQFFLEDLLGRRVGLVTDKALRPELRPSSSARQCECESHRPMRFASDSSHCGPRHPAKAHAMRVARRVAGIDTSRGCERKSLSRQRFPHQPPQYDIVLL